MTDPRALGYHAQWTDFFWLLGIPTLAFVGIIAGNIARRTRYPRLSLALVLVVVAGAMGVFVAK